MTNKISDMLLKDFTPVAIRKIDFLLGQGTKNVEVLLIDKNGTKAKITQYGKVTWVDPIPTQDKQTILNNIDILKAKLAGLMIRLDPTDVANDLIFETIEKIQEGVNTI